MKNMIPTRELQKAMEKQMKAERERREAILIAEGEKKAAVLRADGDTKRPLTFLVLPGLANVVLNLVVVAGFGMDVDGVAWATVISQYISAALVIITLIKEKGYHKKCHTYNNYNINNCLNNDLVRPICYLSFFKGNHYALQMYYTGKIVPYFPIKRQTR